MGNRKKWNPSTFNTLHIGITLKESVCQKVTALVQTQTKPDTEQSTAKSAYAMFVLD